MKSGGVSVLVVDDNAANRKLMSFLLTKYGYSVRTAANADEALAAVREQRPALVLMDIQLPGMDGLALTRKLKADPWTRDTIIMAVTAYAMKGDHEKAFAAGCDAYVTKPIDTRSLPAAIRQALASRGTNREDPQ